MADAVAVGPFHEIIAKPVTTFTSHQLFWNTEVGNPMSLKGDDVVLGLLGLDLTCYLVLCSAVQDGQDRPLLLVGADPDDISLDGLIEAVGLLHVGWSRLIWFLVAQARAPKVVFSHGQNISRSASGLKKVDQGLSRRVTKVPVELLNHS